MRISRWWGSMQSRRVRSEPGYSGPSLRVRSMGRTMTYSCQRGRQQSFISLSNKPRFFQRSAQYAPTGGYLVLQDILDSRR